VNERDTARRFSDFASGLTLDQVPEDVREATRLFVADYLAACYAGLRVNRAFNRAMENQIFALEGPERASVLEAAQRLPAEHAAFLNAVYAHGADLDDGNRKAMGHIAAHVMSAVFALAEERGGKTWGQVMEAILVGYEVFNRLGAMAQPGLVHRGFHSTGMAGGVACAAACARLLGLSAQGVYDSMGIAAIQASGLMIIAESGQALKPLNPANAARTGILSTKLAESGVPGPRRPLDSDRGWLHAVTDQVHEEMLEGLGSEFTLPESYLKPYPSCRHTHCGIEAALRLREAMAEVGLTLSALESLTLYLYPNAIRIAGQIRLPAGPEEAKFSVHYSLACALSRGDYTLEDLEAPPSEEIRRLIEMLRLVPEEALEDRASGRRGCRLEALFTGGKRMVETVDLPKGDRANPMTWEDLERKLSSCLAGFPHDAKTIVQRCRAIDPAAPFQSVCKLVE